MATMKISLGLEANVDIANDMISTNHSALYCVCR
jgi:hypothetical protein